MSTTYFAKWAGISRDHVYTIDYQQGFINRGEKSEIDVEKTVNAICAHYETKPAGSYYQDKAKELRGKLATLKKESKKQYINAYEVMLKMGFDNVYQLQAYQKTHPDFPVGIPSKSRSGCSEILFPLDAVEEHIEKYWLDLRKPGEKKISYFWARKFIRREFAPVRV